MPQQSTNILRTLALSLGCVLLLIPAVEAVVSANPKAPSILLFVALTLTLLFGGAFWLYRHGFIADQPATAYHPAPLIFLVLLGASWAMVLVDTPHSSYFLFVLLVLAAWLLPPLAGAVLMLVFTLGTIGGQIVHHGFNAGAIFGPLLVAIIVLCFTYLWRAMIAETAAKTAALQQLAAAEHEAGVLTERTRIARDLHDTVAQSLSSIQLLLQLAKEQPSNSAAQLELAQEAAARALTETRSFITLLTPPADLAGNSLAGALTRTVTRARQQALSVGSHTEFSLTITEAAAPHLKNLPITLETTLLRAAQVALDNCLQHAQAQRCEVQLDVSDTSTELLLTVVDDGVGFDPEQAISAAQEHGHGYGLQGLIGRVSELGGQLAIVAEPDDGCLITVSLPVPDALQSAVNEANKND